MSLMDKVFGPKNIPWEDTKQQSGITWEQVQSRQSQRPELPAEDNEWERHKQEHGLTWDAIQSKAANAQQPIAPAEIVRSTDSIWQDPDDRNAKSVVYDQGFGY